MAEVMTSTFSDVVKFTIPELSIDNDVFAAAANTSYKKLIPVAVNGDGKYVKVNPVATDGTQITAGLLAKDIAVQSAAVDVRIPILKRLARVVISGIDFTGFTDAQKATAIEELSAQLIVETTEA